MFLPRRIRSFAGRRNVLYQLFHTAAWRMITAGARAVTFVIVVRLLSPRDYGWYALINTTLYISALLGSLSLSAYFIRGLPGRPECVQYAVFRSLVGPILGANLILAAVVAAAGQRYLPPGQGYVAWLVASIHLIELAGGQFENFFLGRKEIQKANWIMGLRTLSVAVFVVGAEIVGWGTLPAVLGAMLAAHAVGLLPILGWLRWDLLWGVRAPRGLWREAMSYSLPLFGSALAFMGMKFGDKYLVVRYLGLVAVARYSFAYSLVNLAYGYAVLVPSAVLTPHIMGAVNEDDLATRNRYLTRLVKLSAYGLILAGSVYAVIPTRFWVLISGHHDYLGVKNLALALAAVSLLDVLGIPADLILEGQKKTGVLSCIVTAGALATAGLDVVLLPRIGLYGAVLGAGLGFAGATALKYRYIWRRRIFHLGSLLDWSDERFVFSHVARLGL